MLASEEEQHPGFWNLYLCVDEISSGPICPRAAELPQLYFAVVACLAVRLVLAMLLIAAASAQTRIPVPTTAGFRGLSVVTEKIIWASGTDGTVIRTIDGGK